MRDQLRWLSRAGALDAHLDPLSPAPLAVAFSGGGDSLATLLIARAWGEKAERPVLALTVDHGLHPLSGEWTRAAGEQARALGCGWRGLAWVGPKPFTGVQARARAARHDLLADAARAAGARVFLTGHTMDDALEADLMRATDARGIGRLRPWSPSPAWPQGRGVVLLRPLLGARRAEVRRWLGEAGLAWLDDPANDDARFSRVRARRALADASLESARDPGEEPPRANAGVKATTDGRLILATEGLDARTLGTALLCASGASRPPASEALERLLARLGAGDAVTATLSGARVEAGQGMATLGREAGERARAGLAPLALRPGEAAVWDGRFEVVAAEPGWTVRPLAGLAARLSICDAAAIHAIPAGFRGALPAFTDGSGRVALPAPFGAGPAHARALAPARLAAALGHVRHERDIP